MICPFCGATIDEKAQVCLHCGNSLTQYKQTIDDSNPSALWWWLGFLVPVAGLLIWLVTTDTEPNKAKKAGYGALVGTIVSVVLVILYIAACIALPFLYLSLY